MIFILQLLPNDLDSEIKLINIMNSYKLKPGLDFINILMKRRYFRKDYIMCDVLKIFRISRISCEPNRKVNLLNKFRIFLPFFKIFHALKYIGFYVSFE